MIQDSLQMEMFQCRLCNKLISKNDVQWIFLKSKNEVTSLGLRVMILLNVKMEEIESLSHTCCHDCCFKVQECFSLLMEVQASNFIVNLIHKHSTENRRNGIFTWGNPNNEMVLDCEKCHCKVSNMKKFIDHYEYHILKDNYHHEKYIMPMIMSFGKVHLCKQKTSHGRNAENKMDALSEMLIKNKATHCKKSENDNVNNGEAYHTEIFNSKNGEGTKIECIIDNTEVNKEDVLKPELNFKCDLCSSLFQKKSTLQEHINFVHLTITKARRLNVMKKTQRNKVLICKYCSSAFPPKSFKAHVSECRAAFLSGGTILCHFCGKSIDYVSMKGHMYMHREHNKGNQTCSICKKTFCTSRSLRSHMILHDESKKVICEICGMKTHPYSLWKHVKKHKTKEKKCMYCDKAFTFNYMLQAHLKTHEQGDDASPLKRFRNRLAASVVHKCPKCEKEYTYVSMLNAHVQEQHNDITVKIESMFGCKMCDKTFDDQYSLKNHLLLMHNASKEDLSNMKASMQLGVFHCTLCESVLQSEYGLRHHMRIVHDLQNKEMPKLMRRDCEKCHRSFSNKAGLTAHIKSVHLNIGYLTCDLCNKTFKRYQGLINHRLIHLGKKPFECEVCTRTFRQRSDVIRHLQRHVRDGDVSLEEAVARNNSDSAKVKKSRIFLKDSSYCSVISERFCRKSQ